MYELNKMKKEDSNLLFSFLFFFKGKRAVLMYRKPGLLWLCEILWHNLGLLWHWSKWSAKRVIAPTTYFLERRGVESTWCNGVGRERGWRRRSLPVPSRFSSRSLAVCTTQVVQYKDLNTHRVGNEKVVLIGDNLASHFAPEVVKTAQTIIFISLH